MSQIDPVDHRALGILSSAMNKQLGISNIVSREVSRAFKSGEIKDLTRAGMLFDTLPRWQKMEVQREAQDQAYLSLEGADNNNTARRWDNLSLEHQKKQFDEELPGRLPSFLIDRDI
ncbi:MAG: hypothetical protein VX962_00120 [Pseudomonadota bacterium]|nr:hypothetical protein [Pseudomonadota bacterium]